MKFWKVWQILGFVIIAIGVAARAGAGEYWGTFAAVVGLAAFVVGRVGAWLASGRP